MPRRCEIWARFEERARRSLRMEPPPAKRIAEVTDIAETIIKTLLPDDEDDCERHNDASESSFYLTKVLHSCWNSRSIHENLKEIQ